MLSQGHPFVSLTVPREEVVIAPREGSLPAPHLFYPLLALQIKGHRFVCEPLSTQGTPTCKAIAVQIIKKILLLY